MNKKESIKKEKEWFYLKFLLKNLNYDYVKLKNPQDDPDFKLMINGKKIGVELVRIFDTENKKFTLMSIENEHKKIADELLSLFNNSSLPIIDILLSFIPSKPLPQKTNYKEYALKLFDVILNNFPNKNTFINIDNAEILPDELANIRIARSHFIDDNFIYVSQSGWLIKDFQNLLQVKINKKDKKIDSYDKTCEEFWLLIYSDGSSGAAMFEPSNKTLSSIYSSKFTRVFFISSLNHKKLYELKLINNFKSNLQ